MLFRRLDVGCGLRPKGDVNLDLYFNEFTEHLDSLDKKLITTIRVKNPVKADAHYLPFKDDSFEEVYSHHVLEHLDNPFKALSEMIRVARHKVVFNVPHRFDREQKRAIKLRTHKHIFTTNSVKQLLSLLNIKKYHISINYSPFPNNFLRLIWLPSEIKVEIWK